MKDKRLKQELIEENRKLKKAIKKITMTFYILALILLCMTFFVLGLSW